MSEFNRAPNESEGAREYKNAPAEYSAAEERKDYSENDVPERNGAPKARKQNGGISRTLASFAAAAIVAVAVVSSGVFSEKGSAEIVDVSVTDTIVRYDVTAEGEDLSVVLYNDFTRRETALTRGENSGSFTELKPGVSYTLAVVEPAAFGSGRTVTERAVKTELVPVPAPVSVWRGVSYECTCAIDGYFRFTMDFDDPNGYYTDFEAKLEDGVGNVSECVFSDDLHAEQRIDVTLRAALSGKRATFTLTYRTADPAAESPLAEYSVEVKI